MNTKEIKISDEEIECGGPINEMTSLAVTKDKRLIIMFKESKDGPRRAYEFLMGTDEVKRFVTVLLHLHDDHLVPNPAAEAQSVMEDLIKRNRLH